MKSKTHFLLFITFFLTALVSIASSPKNKRNSIQIKITRNSCNGCIENLKKEFKKYPTRKIPTITIISPECPETEKVILTNKYRDRLFNKAQILFVSDLFLHTNTSFKQWNKSPELIVTINSNEVYIPYDSCFIGMDLTKYAQDIIRLSCK